jgi:hypothetical protein
LGIVHENRVSITRRRYSSISVQTRDILYDMIGTAVYFSLQD